MVYARTGASHPVALLCCQRQPVLALTEEMPLKGKTWPELCAEPEVIKRVSEACRASCKEQKLADFETPKAFAMVAELWTPQNGLLTDAMKLKRTAIVEAHAEVID